jgi:hypothetical protein
LISTPSAPAFFVAVVMRRIAQIARRHVELPELLLQPHAAEEIAHAIGNGEPRIVIRRARLPGGGSSKGERPQREQQGNRADVHESWNELSLTELRRG